VSEEHQLAKRSSVTMADLKNEDFILFNEDFYVFGIKPAFFAAAIILSLR
jgi:hypothetical protein